MKCKFCNTVMQLMVDDKYVEVYYCNGCFRIAVKNIELYEEILWYQEEMK